MSVATPHRWVHGQLRVMPPWMRVEGVKPRQVKGPLGCADCHVLWPPPTIACLGRPTPTTKDRTS